ncbi:MAG: hypothetical protein QG558_1587 [Campylobacterota bacterium]|nr:hypothetical protein [Campylobacterota bacterium]
MHFIASLRKLGYSLGSEALVKVDSIGLKIKNLFHRDRKI